MNTSNLKFDDLIKLFNEQTIPQLILKFNGFALIDLVNDRQEKTQALQGPRGQVIFPDYLDSLADLTICLDSFPGGHYSDASMVQTYNGMYGTRASVLWIGSYMIDGRHYTISEYFESELLARLAAVIALVNDVAKQRSKSHHDHDVAPYNLNVG